MEVVTVVYYHLMCWEGSHDYHMTSLAAREQLVRLWASQTACLKTATLPTTHNPPLCMYNALTWSRSTTILDSIHSIAIVHLPLLWIRENVIRRLNIFELQDEKQKLEIKICLPLPSLSPFLHRFLPCLGDTVWPAGDKPVEELFYHSPVDIPTFTPTARPPR